MIWLVNDDEVVGGLVFFSLPPRGELDLLVYPPAILNSAEIAELATSLLHGHRFGKVGAYQWTDDPTGLKHPRPDLA
jgi:hypothetical protein